MSNEKQIVAMLAFFMQPVSYLGVVGISCLQYATPRALTYLPFRQMNVLRTRFRLRLTQRNRKIHPRPQPESYITLLVGFYSVCA